MIFRSSLFVLTLLCINSTLAQRIFFASSRSDYSFYDWDLSDSLDEQIGSLEYARIPNDVFSSWNIRIGENSGSIKLRWKENQHDWDLRINNQLASFKPVWPNQFEEWNITSEGKNLNLKLRKEKEGYQWFLTNNAGENLLLIKNESGNDPRDWTFYYYQKLDSSISPITCIFIAAFYSRYIKK